MPDVLPPITHDEDAHRFVAVTEGLTAELNYRLAGHEMVITHVGVPRALEGRGIGSALAKAGLDHARREGLTVTPLCSFARAYIDRNPEYQSLLQSESRRTHPMSQTAPAVVHDEEGQRFTVSADGEVAELSYRTMGNQIIFQHTGVPAALEGRGIGSALAKAGLNYAQQNGMEVIPLCPFVRSYIERKPEYQSLVRK